MRIFYKIFQMRITQRLNEGVFSVVLTVLLTIFVRHVFFFTPLALFYLRSKG